MPFQMLLHNLVPPGGVDPFGVQSLIPGTMTSAQRAFWEGIWDLQDARYREMDAQRRQVHERNLRQAMGQLSGPEFDRLLSTLPDAQRQQILPRLRNIAESTDWPAGQMQQRQQILERVRQQAQAAEQQRPQLAGLPNVTAQLGGALLWQRPDLSGPSARGFPPFAEWQEQRGQQTGGPSAFQQWEQERAQRAYDGQVVPPVVHAGQGLSPEEAALARMRQQAPQGGMSAGPPGMSGGGGLAQALQRMQQANETGGTPGTGGGAGQGQSSPAGDPRLAMLLNLLMRGQHPLAPQQHLGRPLQGAPAGPHLNVPLQALPGEPHSWSVGGGGAQASQGEVARMREAAGVNPTLEERFMMGGVPGRISPGQQAELAWRQQVQDTSLANRLAARPPRNLPGENHVMFNALIERMRRGDEITRRQQDFLAQHPHLMETPRFQQAAERGARRQEAHMPQTDPLEAAIQQILQSLQGGGGGLAGWQPMYVQPPQVRPGGLDADAAKRMAAQQPGTSHQTAPGGPMADQVQRMMQEVQQAQDSAREANERRYQEILRGHQQRIGSVLGALGDRTQQVMQGFQGNQEETLRGFDQRLGALLGQSGPFALSQPPAPAFSAPGPMTAPRPAANPVPQQLIQAMLGTLPGRQ